MIPVEWADVVKAPPGYLLVERREMPRQVGMIVLPSGYRNHTLSGTARIVAVSGGLNPKLQVGRWVMLTASAGRSVVFGRPGCEQRTLARITAAQIMLLLHGEEETSVGAPPILPMHSDVEVSMTSFDEGDPRGLR